MEILAFGDPNQALLYALTITVFGGLVGAIGYAIAANLGAKRAGLAVAAAFVAGAAALSWAIFFTPFYAVEVGPDAISLRKFYPSRAIVIARGDVERFEGKNSVTKNDYTVVLVVHTRDGKSYTSGTTRPQQLADRVARLQQWLAQP